MDTREHIIACINKLFEKASEDDTRTIWYFVRAMLKPLGE